MEMTIDIKVVKQESNGGEYFVYTDGSLMGCYDSLDKVGERLGAERID